MQLIMEQMVTRVVGCQQHQEVKSSSICSSTFSTSPGRRMFVMMEKIGNVVVVYDKDCVKAEFYEERVAYYVI